MFGKSKKGLRGQAEDITGDLSDRLSPYLADARKEAGHALSDARDFAKPYVEEARKKAGPVLSDARDYARTNAEEARDRFNADVLPAVTSALSDARDRAADAVGPYVEEARKESARRGKATAAALRGEVDAPSKGGKLKKVLIAGGLIGLGAYAFTKLRGNDEAGAWQSSYAPPAPPSPAPKPASTAATAPPAQSAPPGTKPPAPDAASKPPAPANKPPAPTTPTAGSVADAADAADAADDAAGASPDEAAADATEAGAHEVTTPDNPVEEVDVRDQDQPGT